MWPNKAYIQGEYEVCPDSIHRYIVIDPCTHPDPIWTMIGGGEIIYQQGDTLDVIFSTPGFKRISASYPVSCGFKTDTISIKVRNCNCMPYFKWIEMETIVCKGAEADIKFATNADLIIIDSISSVINDTFQISGITADSCISARLYFDNFCDTSIIICVKIYPESPIPVDSIYICAGDSVQFGSSWYKNNAIIQYYNINQYGCDSGTIIRVFVKHKPDSSSESIQLCYEDSVMINNIWIQSDTTIIIKYLAFNACDSLHKIKVIKNSPISITQRYHNLFFGDSIRIGTIWIKQSGKYHTTFTSNEGCDSTVCDSVFIYSKPLQTSEEIFICPGDSVLVGIQWIKDNSQLTVTLKNENLCDSFHVINVLLKEAPIIREIRFTLCFGDLITINDVTYKVNVDFTLYKKNGSSECDSSFHYVIEVEDSFSTQFLFNMVNLVLPLQHKLRHLDTNKK